MIYLIDFAVVYACLDRLWGSDVKIMGRSGHSLATAGALITAGVCWFTLHDVYACAMCAAWAIYRSINFSGGAMAPRSLTQAVSALGRHLIATGLLCVILAIKHQGITLDMIPPFSYAFAATSLALGNGATDGKMNWAVEAIRGACFGACVALSLGLV